MIRTRVNRIIIIHECSWMLSMRSFNVSYSIPRVRSPYATPNSHVIDQSDCRRYHPMHDQLEEYIHLEESFEETIQTTQ